MLVDGTRTHTVCAPRRVKIQQSACRDVDPTDSVERTIVTLFEGVETMALVAADDNEHLDAARCPGCKVVRTFGATVATLTVADEEHWAHELLSGTARIRFGLCGGLRRRQHSQKQRTGQPTLTAGRHHFVHFFWVSAPGTGMRSKHIRHMPYCDPRRMVSNLQWATHATEVVRLDGNLHARCQARPSAVNERHWACLQLDWGLRAAEVLTSAISPGRVTCHEEGIASPDAHLACQADR